MRRPASLGGAGLAAAVVAGLAVAFALAALGVGETPGALTDWQALTLGIVQGLTELLPISSSGHLILVPWLGRWTYLEEHDAFNQTFDVALHLGTLVAVVAYFRRDIVTLVAAWFTSVGRRRVERDEDEMARRRDRKQLGQPLDDSERQRLPVCERTGRLPHPEGSQREGDRETGGDGRGQAGAAERCRPSHRGIVRRRLLDELPTSCTICCGNVDY